MTGVWTVCYRDGGGGGGGGGGGMGGCDTGVCDPGVDCVLQRRWWRWDGGDVTPGCVTRVWTVCYRDAGGGGGGGVGGGWWGDVTPGCVTGVCGLCVTETAVEAGCM